MFAGCDDEDRKSEKIGEKSQLRVWMWWAIQKLFQNKGECTR